MKKLIQLRLAAVLVALVPLLAWGSTRTKTVTLTYNASDFTLVQTGGKTHITSSVHDVSCVCDTVAPAIPHFVVDVLVAPNERIVTFNSSFSDTVTWSSVDISPCEIPVTTDMSYTGVYPNVTFTGTCPASVTNEGIMSIDGYSFVRLIVSPFAYDGDTKTLTLNQSVSVNVVLQTLVPVGTPAPTGPYPGGIVMRNLVGGMCVNGDDMNTLYAPATLPDTDLGDEPYRYLLITKNNAMRNKFKSLANWKTRKGVRTKMLTMAEINSTFAGDTEPERVKAAIKYYYDQGLQYVLLGGDENDVPVKREYLERINREKVPYDTIVHHVASDLYYASVKDGSKDKNAASQIFHPNDSVAFYSDLVVTRLPLVSPDYALIISDRITKYESHPDTTDWQDNMLMTGVMLSHTDTICFLPDPISDVHKRSYAMESSYIAPCWPNGTITRFFDTGTDMPGGASYDVTANHMLEQLSKGFTFVHIDTHGSPNTLVMENNGEFPRTHVQGINNKRGSVMALTSCSTNAFDLTGTCMGENFINARFAGTLGYFACSREGYAGISNELNGLFFQQLLQDSAHRFGQAAMEAKNKFAESNVTNRYKHWLLIGVNPLGDPEMPVYISKPKVLTAPRYTFTNGSLYVTNLVDSCNICVMSEADFGDTYYAVHRNVQGASVFHNVPTNSSVCITKPGYIPLVTNLQQLSVVQNTTISEDMLIVGDAVVVGEAVTNELPHGHVIVESGTTTIVAPNGVKLYPGTYVRKGAGLKIQTK